LEAKYKGWTPDEGWFILTNLENSSAAITAYSRAVDVGKRCWDFKKAMTEGPMSGDRLIVWIFKTPTPLPQCREKFKRMGVQNISVPGERSRKEEHSGGTAVFIETPSAWVNL